MTEKICRDKVPWTLRCDKVFRVVARWHKGAHQRARQECGVLSSEHNRDFMRDRVHVGGGGGGGGGDEAEGLS